MQSAGKCPKSDHTTALEEFLYHVEGKTQDTCRYLLDAVHLGNEVLKAAHGEINTRQIFQWLTLDF